MYIKRNWEQYPRAYTSGNIYFVQNRYIYIYSLILLGLTESLLETMLITTYALGVSCTSLMIRVECMYMFVYILYIRMREY